MFLCPFSEKNYILQRKGEIKDLIEIRIPRCTEMLDFLNYTAKTVKAFSTFPSLFLYILSKGWIAFDLVSGFRFLGGPELCTLHNDSVLELKLLSITFYPFIHARFTVRLSFFQAIKVNLCQTLVSVLVPCTLVSTFYERFFNAVVTKHQSRWCHVFLCLILCQIPVVFLLCLAEWRSGGAVVQSGGSPTRLKSELDELEWPITLSYLGSLAHSSIRLSSACQQPLSSHLTHGSAALMLHFLPCPASFFCPPVSSVNTAIRANKSLLHHKQLEWTRHAFQPFLPASISPFFCLFVHWGVLPGLFFFFVFLFTAMGGWSPQRCCATSLQRCFCITAWE